MKFLRLCFVELLPFIFFPYVFYIISNCRWRAQEDGLKNEETIAESGRLFVRNLPYTAQEEELEELFKPFGPLAEVNLPIDKNTRKIKGFAFITYVIPENAVQAFTKLDGTTFQGRLLHLIPGRSGY